MRQGGIGEVEKPIFINDLSNLLVVSENWFNSSAL